MNPETARSLLESSELKRALGSASDDFPKGSGAGEQQQMSVFVMSYTLQWNGYVLLDLVGPFSLPLPSLRPRPILTLHHLLF